MILSYVTPKGNQAFIDNIDKAEVILNKDGSLSGYLRYTRDIKEYQIYAGNGAWLLNDRGKTIQKICDRQEDGGEPTHTPE